MMMLMLKIHGYRNVWGAGSSRIINGYSPHYGDGPIAGIGQSNYMTSGRSMSALTQYGYDYAVSCSMEEAYTNPNSNVNYLVWEIAVGSTAILDIESCRSGESTAVKIPEPNSGEQS